MPNYENNNSHGSLIITIDVEFPKNTFSEQDKKGSYNLFVLFHSLFMQVNKLTYNLLIIIF